MNKIQQRIARTGMLILALLVFVNASTAFAAPAASMEREARSALKDLYKTSDGARALGEKAKAVLVFPSITKGGFIVGGQYGEGTLFHNGKVDGYFRTVAASYGLQAGIQKFGYALFFMDDSDLQYLRNSEGWELGVGPSITIVDEGMAGSFTTTTARSGVFAFFFSQKGLMAGLGIQGTKITQIHPKTK